MLSVSKEISIEHSDLVELSRNGEKASFTMNIDIESSNLYNYLIFNKG